MDFFQHPYYRLNKMLMSVTGQWPYQSARTSRGFRIVLFLLTISHMLPQIMFVVKCHDEWRILMDSIVPLLFDVFIATKYICCFSNSHKMEELLNRIRTDWRVWARDQEVRILHEYADQGRKMTIVYSVSLFSMLILFISQPIIPKMIDFFLNNGSKPGEFPIPVDYYFLNAQNYYVYFIMHSNVCISASLVIGTANDCMLIIYVQHACGIFAALGHKLERIGENKGSTEKIEKVYTLHERDMDMEHLFSCINRHIDAIKYAELIETTYSWCFFFIVGINMLGISLTGLQIVKGTTDLQQTIKFAVCHVVTVVHLYLENYMSQILIDHSIGIRCYIHNGKWYRLSLKAQKLLNLMMMRCNVSCKLSAGKIAAMSVETFAVCLKTSLSYFMFLRSV